MLTMKICTTSDEINTIPGHYVRSTRLMYTGCTYDRTQATGPENDRRTVVMSLSGTTTMYYWALFSSRKNLGFTNVILSVLFSNYYSIIDQLSSKNSSRKLQVNFIISYLFYLYLVFHACAAKFDVTENLEKFWKLNKTHTEETNAVQTRSSSYTVGN